MSTMKATPTATTSNKPVRYINVTLLGLHMGIGLFAPKPLVAIASEAQQQTHLLQSKLITADIEKVEALINKYGLEFVSVKDANPIAPVSDKVTDALSLLD